MSCDHFGDLRRARFLTLRVLRAIGRTLTRSPVVDPARVGTVAALGSILHRIAVVHEFPEERRLLRAWPDRDAETQALRQDHEATRLLAVSLCTLPEGALRDPRTSRLVQRAARCLVVVDGLLEELELSWKDLSEVEQRRIRPLEGLRPGLLDSWSRELSALEDREEARPARARPRAPEAAGTGTAG